MVLAKHGTCSKLRSFLGRKPYVNLLVLALAVPLTILFFRPQFESFISYSYSAIAVFHLLAITMGFIYIRRDLLRHLNGIRPWSVIALTLILILAFYLRYSMFSYQSMWNIHTQRANGFLSANGVDLISIMQNYSVMLALQAQIFGLGIDAVQNFSLAVNSLSCVAIFVTIYLLTKNQNASLFASLLTALATQTIILPPIIAGHASFFFISLTAMLYILYTKEHTNRALALLFIVMTFAMGIEIENAFLLLAVMASLVFSLNKEGLKKAALPFVILTVSLSPLMLWYMNYDRIFLCGEEGCRAAATAKFPEIAGKEAFLGTFYAEAFGYKFPRVLQGVAAFPHFYSNLSSLPLGPPLLTIERVGMSNIFIVFIAFIASGLSKMKRNESVFFIVWLFSMVAFESFAWQHAYVFDESAIAFYPALIIASSAGIFSFLSVVKKKAKWRWSETVVWILLVILLLAGFGLSGVISPQHEDKGYPYPGLRSVSQIVEPGSCVIVAQQNDIVFFYGKDVFSKDFEDDGIGRCRTYYFDYETSIEKSVNFVEVRERLERTYTLNTVQMDRGVNLYLVSNEPNTTK